MALSALPAIVLFQEQDIFASAARTLDTVRPAPRYQKLAAVGRIREVNDGFLKRAGLLFHASSLATIPQFVNYIIALARAMSPNGTTGISVGS